MVGGSLRVGWSDVSGGGVGAAGAVDAVGAVHAGRTRAQDLHAELVALDGVVDVPAPSPGWIPGFNFVDFHQATAAMSRLDGIALDGLEAYDRYDYPVYVAIGVSPAGGTGAVLYADESLMDERERSRFLERLRERIGRLASSGER